MSTIRLQEFPKPHSEDAKIFKYISSIVGKEISGMTKACYYPKFIGYWGELKFLTGIDKSRVDYIRKHIRSEYKKFDLLNVESNLAIMLCVYHYTNSRQYDIAKMFYYLLAISMYSSRVHKHIQRFCKENVWNLAFDNLSTKHLFKLYKGIPSAIIYLANVEYERYKKNFSKSEIDDHIDLYLPMYSLRTRIAQSVRSFFQLYYKLDGQNAGGISSVSDEEMDQNNIQGVSNIQFIARHMTQLMCIYGQIDSSSLDEAIKLVGIRKDLGYSIISELSSSNYLEQIKFIILLFGRVLPIQKICSESKRRLLIRKIESGEKIGNYVIKDEVINLILNSGVRASILSISKSQLNLFFLNYLTLFIKKRICA